MRVLSCLRASISPPPAGRGMCERTDGLRLRAGWRFACFSSCRVALSLALDRYCLACGSGFPLVPRFSLLTGSGLGGRHRAPSSFRPVFPVPCVSYCVLAFRPCLIRRVRSDRRPCFSVLALAIAWRCRVILSVRSACFVHLGLVRPRVGLALVRPSCCLASFRPSPRLAYRRTGRLGVPFLVVARSSVAGRLAPCPPPVFLACFPASVSCGMAVGGGVPRCPCVPLACCLLSRLGSCVGGVGVSCLRVACSRYAYRPVPHIEERSDISRFDCSFSFFPIRR